MTQFRAGAQVPLQNGGSAVVKEKIGEGGQGDVYRVAVNGKPYALKWYHGTALKEPAKFYANLENNIRHGAPTSAFLWPLFLTEPYDGEFGYVMNLRPQRYKDFSDFLLTKAKFESISAVVNAALNITNGFRELHRKGFSYQDLNDGNFFIDPATGEVLICDNDNVAPYGESLGIAGKARYMAPEVVRNIERPNIMTDRFSLAVILFRLLFLDHPLEGKKTLVPCLTEEHEQRFYGKSPVFIYDPHDTSHLPVRGVHCNVLKLWPLYPKFIKEKFIKSFSQECMIGGAPRLTDNDWQIAFTRLRDMIVMCPCGGETFIDIKSDRSKCINCGMEIPTPPLLMSKKYAAVLFPGNKIYRCHIDSDSDDYSEVVGSVIRSKNQPNVWGLRNLSDSVWTAAMTDGSTKTAEHGDVLILSKTEKIDFGNCEGTIKLAFSK